MLPETAEGVDVIFVRLRVVLVLLIFSVFIGSGSHDYRRDAVPVFTCCFLVFVREEESWG